MNPVFSKTLRAAAGALCALLFLWFFLPSVLTTFHIGSYTGMFCSAALFFYAAFAPKVNAFICRAWKKISGKLLLSAFFLVLAVISGFALACIFSIESAALNAEAKGDTVIVLGCKVNKSGPSLMLKSRLDAAYDYLEQNSGASAVLCGGQGKNEPVTEAFAMYEYLTELGISSERLYLDDTSEDTFENLENALEIIEENSLPANACVVTSDYHLYRALNYAEETGVSVSGGIGAKTPLWLLPINYVREMYGIMEMWLLN